MNPNRFTWQPKFAWWWVHTEDFGWVRWRAVLRKRELKAFDFLWRVPVYGWRYRVEPPWSER